VAEHSSIEWTEATLNVVTGCTKVSDGCIHCYIERTPPFRKDGRRFDKPGIGGSTGLVFHPERLVLPMRWRKPRRIFVNSLSDLWHDDVPDGLIAALWFMMGQSAGMIPERYRGHTFQILTKRPARMRAWLRRWADTGDPAIQPMDPAASRCGRAELVEAAAEYLGGPTAYDWMDGPRYWPTALPGVWLGVSAEDQRSADNRIPILNECPAVVRFVSAEPLLGPVDLTHHLSFGHCPEHDFPGGFCVQRQHPGVHHLNWVIAGGESGPGARPAHPDWFQSLRDQCRQAGVAFHFKQWGEWVYRNQMPEETYVQLDQAINLAQAHPEPFRVGKKRAGRLLDGRTWDEYPEVSHA
jgi:protein gp37